MLRQQIRKHYYKTLRTSVINSLMSLTSLIFLLNMWHNFKHKGTWGRDSNRHWPRRSYFLKKKQIGSAVSNILQYTNSLFLFFIQLLCIIKFIDIFCKFFCYEYLDLFFLVFVREAADMKMGEGLGTTVEGGGVTKHLVEGVNS